MKRPVDTAATDIGPGSGKILAGARPVEKRIDQTDPDQVFDLAHEIQDANDRRVMQLTLNETRAIARNAVTWATVATQAADYLDLLDNGAPQEECDARLAALRKAAGR